MSTFLCVCLSVRAYIKIVCFPIAPALVRTSLPPLVHFSVPQGNWDSGTRTLGHQKIGSLGHQDTRTLSLLLFSNELLGEKHILLVTLSTILGSVHHPHMEEGEGDQEEKVRLSRQTLLNKQK